MAHHSDDYKRAAVRHYLNVSHNRAKTCRIFGCLNITLGRGIRLRVIWLATIANLGLTR